MFWPSKLAIFYPYPNTLPMWKFAGAGLILAFLFVLASLSMRRRPYFTVGWLWFIGTLVPVIGLVQVGSFSMADRYTYIPLIGLFIIIAWGTPDLVAGMRYRRVILFMAPCIVLLGLMVSTRIQVLHWKNSITLFQHTNNITSNNFLAHNNLGAALYEQGKIMEAVYHYSQALKIKPYFVGAHNNLGVALYGQGKITEAMSHYSEALRIEPNFAEAHNNMGLALYKQGKAQEAMIHYFEALRIKPDYAIAHNNLGASLAENGRFEEAIRHFSEALRIKPDYVEAYRNLLLAHSLQ
jgi:predicted O-linked N-acetylglucosamine transferase (SPINDLY family)